MPVLFNTKRISDGYALTPSTAVKTISINPYEKKTVTFTASDFSNISKIVGFKNINISLDVTGSIRFTKVYTQNDESDYHITTIVATIEFNNGLASGTLTVTTEIEGTS